MRPLSLLAVSTLFLILGILAIVEVIISLMHHRISPNLAVCLLFVGIGLFKLKASSRRWAIAWIGLGYLLCVILLYGYFLLGNFNALTVLAGETDIQGPVRFLLCSAIPLVIALLLLWMHRILRRPDIVALFEETQNEEPSDD